MGPRLLIVEGRRLRHAMLLAHQPCFNGATTVDRGRLDNIADISTSATSLQWGHDC